jgi:hypothetical protein
MDPSQGLAADVEARASIEAGQLTNTTMTKPTAWITAIAVVVACTGVYLLVTNMTHARDLSVKREIDLLPGRSSRAEFIFRTADSGYLVVLDASQPVLLKLDRDGKTLWAFETRPLGSTDVRFTAVAADRGGGALVCATRKGGPRNLQYVPGLIIRLNNAGQETARLDASRDAPNGEVAPVFRTRV